jgi:hypothetical protein
MYPTPHLFENPGGINFRLERLQAHIWWQGKSGMLASQLPKQIRIMLQFEDPPSYLVVPSIREQT